MHVIRKGLDSSGSRGLHECTEPTVDYLAIHCSANEVIRTATGCKFEGTNKSTENGVI